MWLSIVPFVLVTALVVVLPGAVVNLAAGLPRINALALAPLTSLGLVAVAAILAEQGGFRWSPVPVAILTAVVALAIVQLLDEPAGQIAEIMPDGTVQMIDVA